MGVFNILGPVFGLPFVTGSLPHSPQFVRALTSTVVVDKEKLDDVEASQREITVVEGRVAPLLMYLFIGFPLLFPATVHVLPEATIAGLLAYVGVEGILGTQLWKRLLLLVTPQSMHPRRYRMLNLTEIHLFTFLQLFMLLLCWLVNLSPYGLCVAFVVVALVPTRNYILPMMFSEKTLSVIDVGEDQADAYSYAPISGKADDSVGHNSDLYIEDDRHVSRDNDRHDKPDNALETDPRGP